MTTSSPIKAILFDADGVIVYPPFRFVAYLEQHHGLTMADTQGFFRGPFQECLVGRADLKETIAPFLDEWGWDGSVDAFLDCWFTEEHVIDQRLLAVVEAYRDQGIYCGLATNQERYRLDYMTQEMGFGNHFDGIFGSATVGAVKPQRLFYQRITQALNLAPQQILFWDDSPRNVAAAIEFGWHAEHYTTFPTFEIQLSIYHRALAT